jgi:hypothetical protein
MKLNYTQEKYEYWAQFKLVSFKRKLENETAFDGIVKIYSLKTVNEDLNQLLNGRFFGDFNYPAEDGVFLRMFDNKDSWPKTSLIYLNVKSFSMEYLNHNSSSWNVWVGNKLENGFYSIEISPNEILKFRP